MTAPHINYAAVYRQLPVPVVLLTPELEIADVNQAFLESAGRAREEVLGRDLFDAFPDNPLDPGDTGERSLRASVRRVLATGQHDAMQFQKHDVEVPGIPGMFAERYWSAVSAPVFGPDGRVMLIAHCVEDVADRLSRFMSALEADAEGNGPG